MSRFGHTKKKATYMTSPRIIVSPFSPEGRVTWTIGDPPTLTLTAEPVAALRQLMVYAPTCVLPGAWPHQADTTGLRPGSAVHSARAVARHIAETAGARIRADRSASHLHHEARVLLADLNKRGAL